MAQIMEQHASSRSNTSPGEALGERRQIDAHVPAQQDTRNNAKSELPTKE